MAQRRYADGGIFRTYQVLSWVLLRAYGAGFGYLAWTTQQWVANDHPLLPDLILTVPEGIASGILWALAVAFAVPFLTPPFIARPRTVWSGLAKGLVLALATVALSSMIDVVLMAERSDLAEALRPNVILMLRACGTLAVVSAVVVGFVSQLNRRADSTRVSHAAAPVDDVAWAAQITAAYADRPDVDQLREMRQNRMPRHKHVPIFRK